MMGIRKCISNMTQSLRDSWKTTEVLKEVIDCIRNSDANGVSDLLKATQFNADQTQHILTSAIRKNDIAVFSTVLNNTVNGNPNHVVTTHDCASPDGVYKTDFQPLLAYAIQAGAGGVAIFLLCHPDLDVNAKSQTQVVRNHGHSMLHTSLDVESRFYEENMLDMAKTRGMDIVADALLARIVTDEWEKKMAAKTPATGQSAPSTPNLS